MSSANWRLFRHPFPILIPLFLQSYSLGDCNIMPCCWISFSTVIISTVTKVKLLSVLSVLSTALLLSSCNPWLEIYFETMVYTHFFLSPPEFKFYALYAQVAITIKQQIQKCKSLHKSWQQIFKQRQRGNQDGKGLAKAVYYWSLGCCRWI